MLYSPAEFAGNAMPSRISRRVVIKAIGGTTFCLAAGVSAGAPGKVADGVFRPNAYLEIGPDNNITFWVKKCEMGQQIHLAIAAIVADELGAQTRQISLRQAPTMDQFGAVSTGGSYAIPGFWRAYRPLVAAAREMLVAAAASDWRVEPGEVDVQRAMLVHAPSGRTAPLGDFARAASALDVPDDPVLRSAAAFRSVGTVSGRQDAIDILTGSARFGLDVRLPGMRFAVLAKSPVVGGKLKRFDRQAALSVPGVEEVVSFDEALAVVASDSWSAIRGRDLLGAEWEPATDATATSDNIGSILGDPAGPDAVLVREDGDRIASDTPPFLRLQYEMPPAQHAAVEPVNATALVTDGTCKVWGPVQMASIAQRRIAEVLGLPEGRVIVHTTLAGGSFGRKLEIDYAVEAAQIAAKINGPVQLLYTREDDMCHGGVRPPTRHAFAFRRDAGGQRIALQYDYAAASTFAQQDPAQLAIRGYDWASALGAVDLPYAFDHLRIRQRDVDVPSMRLNWWRGTYRNGHAYAIECAIDELASYLGEDPLELRLKLLKRDIRVETFPDELSDVSAKRLGHVLAEAARRCNYGSSDRPGRAVGLACHCYSDVHTYVAHAVDVTIDRTRVSINKVVAVVDCGLAVVPDSVIAQMEGSVIFGLTSALWGDVDVRDGQVQTRNFTQSRLMRMQEVPDIEVHIVDSDSPPGGMGEPPLPSVTPAFLNAIARAGGPRLRRLPVGDRIQLG